MKTSKFYKIVETSFDDLKKGDIVLKQGDSRICYELLENAVLRPNTEEQGDAKANARSLKDLIEDGAL
jgi:hypothetical protein